MSTVTIDKKLFGAFSAMLLFTIVLLVLHLIQSRESNTRMQTVLHHYNVKSSIGKDIELATVQMQGAQRGLMVSYEAKDEASAPQYVTLYANSSAQIDKLLSQLSSLADSPDEIAVISQVREGTTAWKPRFEDLVNLCKAGEISRAYELRSQNKVISANMLQAAIRLEQIQQKAMDHVQEVSDAAVRQAAWVTGIVAFFSLLACASVIIIVRQIVRQLRDAVQSLSSGADELASGSGQIAKSSQALAQGTCEQAAAIEQTSAATEEITSMARKNSQNASQAAEFMEQTVQIVQTANHSLSEMRASMDEINESSDKVGKIIKTIEQIAFQTNILALNAAVESARAGEAGMGFAVVADEVKTLAERSARAADDTARLIEDSIAKSRLGNLRLQQVSRSIDGITHGTAKATELVEAVKQGSDQQAHGANQILSAMTNIEAVTQASAAGAEEGAATGQQMNAQANSLRSVVEVLHAMVGHTYA